MILYLDEAIYYLCNHLQMLSNNHRLLAIRQHFLDRRIIWFSDCALRLQQAWE